MKLGWKPVCAAVLLLGTVVMGGGVHAAPAGEYTLEDLSLKVTIPDGLYVFQPETVADDPDAEALGLDGAALAESLTAQNIYLDAVSKDLTWELAIVMQRGKEFEDIHDFNLYEDAFFDGVVESARESYATAGLTLEEDYTVWTGGQAKFVVVNTRQDQDGAQTLRRQYYTIYNGQAINYTLVSYSGELTEEMTQAQQAVVEGAQFTETLPAPAEALENANQVDDDLRDSAGRIWTHAFWDALGGGVLGGGIVVVRGLIVKSRKKRVDPSAGETGKEG